MGNHQSGGSSLQLSSSIPLPPTCVAGTHRILFLQLGVCKDSGTSKKSGQGAGKGTLKMMENTGPGVITADFFSSEGVSREEAGNRSPES